MQPDVLEEIYHILDHYCAEVDLKALIKSFVQDKAGEGSRWAEMTQCTHSMLGGTSPLIVNRAALMEMIVLAFDMIDDLQDQDNFSKSWMSCQPAYTLNAVLTLLIAFMGEIGKFPQKSDITRQTVTEISRLLSLAIGGQQRDLNDSVRTEADYMAMVQLKAGLMIQLACYMGYSLVDDIDRETIAGIDELAHYIGIIAQLQNDLNDVLRYDLKNDLLQKKRTLPIIYLLEDSDQEFPPLSQFYRGEISQEAFLGKKQECLTYIHESGCIEYVNIIHSMMQEKAEELFAGIAAVSPWKEKFRAITFGPIEEVEHSL